MVNLFGVIGDIHQRNQERRENIANALLNRNNRHQRRDSSSSEAEDTGDRRTNRGRRDSHGSSSDSQEEPNRGGLFNPLGFLGGGHKEEKPKKKKLEPSQLPRALFSLGVSLVDVSVETGKTGEGHGVIGYARFLTPIRHAMYANSIMDGYTNFFAGATYAALSKVKEYTTRPSFGLSAPVSTSATILGLCTQGVVYGGYILCFPGVVAYKVALINKQNS